jgi:hypothetical protein
MGEGLDNGKRSSDIYRSKGVFSELA